MTFTDPNLLPVGSADGRLSIVAGDGIELIDADGRRYLDAASGVGVASLGYGVSEAVDAMAEQASTVQYVHALRFDTPVVHELASEIARLAPGSLDAVFFTSGGSEANESAFKLARQYWALAGHPTRWKIIGRQPSYHGNTLAALSAGWHAGRRKRYAPYLQPFPHVPAPNMYRGCRLCEGRCTAACADAIEEVIALEGVETIAAIIVEPVVAAAGGALVPPPSYFPRVREICDRYGLLLIVDEVITGFGRLGTPFGIERFGVESDILTFGKGVAAGYAPLAGIIASSAILDALRDTNSQFEHSFTMSGHPVACAAGVATLRILRREGLIERVAALEAPFFDALRAELDGVDIVGDIRGMGLLAGVELVTDRVSGTPFPADLRLSDRAAGMAADEGVLVYACHGGSGPDAASGDSLLLMPPFISTEPQLREMARRLALGLQRLSREVSTVTP